jgi:hypothetical protein
MFSTLVLFDERPAKLDKDARVEGLVRTLASLVPHHVEGILGDVRLIGPAGYGLDRIADYAGCALIEAKEDQSFRPIFETLRHDQFLLLRSGYALKTDFLEEARDLGRLDQRKPSPALKLLAEPEHFFQRLFPGSAEIAGIIAPRSWGLAQSCGPLSVMLRGRRSSGTLRTRARRTI